ncbi:hypothetical protein AURDEDRAFT_174117 [Auricularia subglabra TFB-10046 SS5]|nr:hypothetical protein AURDEDRAFT_174117 [Auricularia subglabra TFB-10046 SS5]
MAPTPRMFSLRSALVSLAALALVSATPVEKRQIAGPHTGRATWYPVGLGVCGKRSKPSDFMMAVSPEVFNAFPGAVPGRPFDKQATVSYKGKIITVDILDMCPTCGFNDIDLSSGAFQALIGDLNIGLAEGVTWQINGL